MLLILLPLVLRAETDGKSKTPWALCPPLNPAQINYSPPPAFADDQKEETRISAEQVENAAGDTSIFSGKVLIERDGLRLGADRAVFLRPQQRLELLGNIRIDTGSLGVGASDGWLDLQTNSGEFNHTHYYLPDAHMRGSAPRLSTTRDKQTLLVDSRFTSCPDEDPDWYLDTGLLRLDHENAVGTAKHAVLWFKHVPVFYSPYISFPLGDARRSGFLMPGFGTSSSRGFELAIPWYWNIAPNQDATFTPTYMRKRGTLLATNYRFLGRSSEGEMDLEYLNNDSQLDRERYLIKYRQLSRMGSSSRLELLASDVSDNDYLDDMSSDIDLSNVTHLERRATLNHYAGPMSLSLMAQSFETVDDSISIDNRPYRRLPQITLNGNGELFGSDLTGSLQSEWVEFKHESDSREEGRRFYAYPKLSWPLQGHAWYVKPAAGLHHTRYSIVDGNDNEIDIEDRKLAIGSLDAGLFFEREAGEHRLQTLEPRIFYLNIPYQDQSNIPLFDTGEADFSFAQLFRENRFTGIDRIGDTKQLTLGLTSRLLDTETGDEYMSISLGQIYYYDDRRVTLDNTPATENESDLVSEFSARSGNWTGRATLQWNHQTDEADRKNLQLHYKDDGNGLFNLAYRFRRDPLDESDNLEQTDVSFSWPVSRTYTLMARWNYSLTEERDIETLFGVEYDSCCWAMRLVAHRYLTDDTVEPYDTSVMLQLIFKGLGSVHGEKATTTLKHAILGYQPEY